MNVSKIDMRGLCKCPFRSVDSVQCMDSHIGYQATRTQYVCECMERYPAPQSRRDDVQ